MKKNKYNYDGYDDAYKNGNTDVWSGCGKLGRCMPCGRIHNFDYRSGDHYVNRFLCWYNYGYGCPENRPEPQHEYKNGKCIRCGSKDYWVAPDKVQFRTLKDAYIKKWKRKDLKKLSEISVNTQENKDA